MKEFYICGKFKTFGPFVSEVKSIEINSYDLNLYIKVIRNHNVKHLAHCIWNYGFH